MTARIRHPLFLFLLLVLATGCATNYIRSGLSNSNPVVMPTVTENTIYIQTGNTSENQQVSLSDLNSLISRKGYQVLDDPARLIIGCRRASCTATAKDGITAENVALTGLAPASEPVEAQSSTLTP
jgi:hypothetical protein